MASQAAMSLFNSLKSSTSTSSSSSSRTIVAHRPGLPQNSIWTSMAYPLPRGRCLQKTSIVSNCPCQRFMVHPLKAQTSFECDGCGHHASFHAMKSHEEEVEAAVVGTVVEIEEDDEDEVEVVAEGSNAQRGGRGTLEELRSKVIMMKSRELNEAQEDRMLQEVMRDTARGTAATDPPRQPNKRKGMNVRTSVNGPPQRQNPATGARGKNVTPKSVSKSASSVKRKPIPLDDSHSDGSILDDDDDGDFDAAPGKSKKAKRT